MMFAKLFDRPLYGQVLVKIDQNDEGAPEVRFYVRPPAVGVCTFALTFDDSDDGQAEAEEMFSKITEQHADEAASSIFQMTGSSGVLNG